MLKSSAAIGKGDKDGPSFGQAHAGSDSAPAQVMHDISKGRYQYITDFMSSLNRGPVKLEYGKEAKPLSEKEKAMDELNERNLNLIQRSLVLGSVMAAGGCYMGWMLTKWYYGVSNMNEFSQVMKQKMPKVSGEMKDSMIGRQMQEASNTSRDTISENPELTDWRRSLRNKFNTPEGAQIARQNSIEMRERREAERIQRRTKTEEQLAASQVASAAVAAAASAKVEGADESMTVTEAAAAPPAAETSSETPPPTTRAARLQRATSQVFVDIEKGAIATISSGVDLARSVSGVAEKSVKQMARHASQLAAPEPAAAADSAEPKAS